ncbi:MAG: nucleotidyltransferase domain-containing protein [archaeon]
MVKKKTEKKIKAQEQARENISKKIESKIIKDKKKPKKPKVKKIRQKDIPTLKLKSESDIAMDFAVRVYQRFDKMVKSIVLFGSAAKKSSTTGSDIDIIILIDDVSIMWDQKLIVWYREELDKILRANPYKKNLHINTIKLSTWWEDLIRGDPVVINIIRYGESMIDFGGFFEPLKFLLIKGKIRPTPEAIYAALQRAPGHIMRSKIAELSAIEGLYWAMVDSAHAALIATGISPPSPEHISIELKENFVNNKKLDMKYVIWYRDLLILHKEIAHGKIHDLKGVEIDAWQQRTEEFLATMANLVNSIIG